jgi:hypothetical protein
MATFSETALVKNSGLRCTQLASSTIAERRQAK